MLSPEPERHLMSDAKLPLLHKAPVEELRVHVARSGMAIGDTARIERLADGRVGIFARIRQPILGLIPRWRDGLIGVLGPLAEEVVSPSLDHGDALRVRIVALVPEYLANGFPPEVHVSVWGDPRHLSPMIAALVPNSGLELPPRPQGRLSRLEMI